MKRKVKFQEGGMVETPSQRRVRLAEDARTRSLELRDFEARQARARAEALRDVERFNERMNRAMPITPEEARRLGAEPVRRPVNPRPSIAARVPAAAGAVARGASRAIPGMNVIRGVTPTSLEAGAEFERAGLAQARQDALMRERAAMEQEQAEAAQRMPTPRPARARPAAVPFRELSADRLNELAMGAEPATMEERLAQMRIMQRRREMEEASPRMERPAPAPARMEDMGGSGNIGAASARERGEQVGPPGQYNMKRGGKVPAPKAVVKKKAGGMVAAKPKAAPKKMMKGGIVAKPKSKAKPMAKPMPFKKGGAIKKGRK